MSAWKHGVRVYYDQGGITIYHGDCRSACLSPGGLAGFGDVLVTDPPYGVAYKSGRPRAALADSIVGDGDTSVRDTVLSLWDGPALVFGSWKRPRPEGTHTRLIWDTKGALGMGDLSVPWKPSDQEVYVIGRGFTGPRTSNVLRVAPVQSMAKNGRQHPHEKPVSLMRLLIEKCPPGVILDPFMGSGSTLVAAQSLGRQAVGIEVDESYCEIAVQRLAQLTIAAA